jgi:hypothetical protein
MESQLTETLKLVAAQQRVNVRDIFPTEKQEKKDHKKSMSKKYTHTFFLSRIVELFLVFESFLKCGI